MKTFFLEYGCDKYHQIDTDWIDTVEQIDDNVCEIKYCRLDSSYSINYGRTETLKVRGMAANIIRDHQLR
mgnify:CR=1 FL=1